MEYITPADENSEPEYHCIILNQPRIEQNINDEIYKVPSLARGLLHYEEQKFDNILTSSDFLIIVTMYNEPHSQFHKTMSAINRNLLTFNKNKIPSWKISVVVIVDGLSAFLQDLETNKSKKKYYKPLFSLKKILNWFEIGKNTKNYTEILLNKKLYGSTNEDLTLNFNQFQKLNQRNKISTDWYTEEFELDFAHLFVNTVNFDSSTENNIKVYFCVKHHNKRKLNSHLWFFGGFCTEINPKHCMLIDVGTEPQDDALYNLYISFKNEKALAGVCGEIIPVSEKNSIFDILFYAQKVEYKFSYILDKAFESTLGYISVLPGAFSAYRWKLLEAKNPDGPLWSKYFKSILRPWEMNCYSSNIYLAEDRVLCFALVCSVGRKNKLKYVKDSVAFTDPPNDYSSLLLQRRRWINGSWFALLHTIQNCRKMWDSDHSRCRKLVFSLQIIYYVLNLVYSFFLVGGFYLAMSIEIRYVLTEIECESFNGIGKAILNLYILLLIITFLISIGSNLRDSQNALKIISSFYSAYMLLFLVLLFGVFIRTWHDPLVLVFAILTAACFFLILLLNKCLLVVLQGCVQFLIATPTYINVFTMYAICNIHDCSWGNRPDQASLEEQSTMEDFEKFRAGWALLWAFTNAFFAYTLEAANSSTESNKKYIYAVGIIGLCILYIKFIGGLIYLLQSDPTTKNTEENSHDPIVANNRL